MAFAWTSFDRGCRPWASLVDQIMLQALKNRCVSPLKSSNEFSLLHISRFSLPHRLQAVMRLTVSDIRGDYSSSYRTNDKNTDVCQTITQKMIRRSWPSRTNRHANAGKCSIARLHMPSNQTATRCRKLRTRRLSANEPAHCCRSLARPDGNSGPIS